MKTKYNFYVKDASEVDFARILKEAPAEVDAILLTAKHSVAALFLRNEFLGRFDPADGLRVGIGLLHSGWGSFFLPDCRNTRNSVAFEGGGAAIDGWRWSSFGTSYIPTALKDLAAARAFIPRREVRVSYV